MNKAKFALVALASCAPAFSASCDGGVRNQSGIVASCAQIVAPSGHRLALVSVSASTGDVEAIQIRINFVNSAGELVASSTLPLATVSPVAGAAESPTLTVESSVKFPVSAVDAVISVREMKVSATADFK